MMSHDYVNATEAIIDTIPAPTEDWMLEIEMIHPQYPIPVIPTVIKNSQQIWKKCLNTFNKGWKLRFIFKLERLFKVTWKKKMKKNIKKLNEESVLKAL